MELLIRISYFLAAVLFIVGLKRMGSPKTARGGILWAGAGMALAVAVTFAWPGMDNYVLMIVAIVSGSTLAWYSGQRVAMTAMPQMVALYNGMGGGSAAAIGAVELFQGTQGHELDPVVLALAIVGALIGAVSFSGSLIAFSKLQGWLDKPYRFAAQQVINALFFVATVALGVALFFQLDTTLCTAFFVLALVFGVLMTLPIGGADMPVVISLFNALTGLAVAFEGFVLQNEAMIIAGTVVGAAGTMLTQLMAKAMNRSLWSVLFGNFGQTGGGDEEIEGTMKPIEAHDAAVMMAFAESVVIAPGYGMAVAQAQHKVWDLAKQLIERGVRVRFAIHPVAGRMPGHMNVLLAEAGVSYELIEDLEDINPEFPRCDVALVIGANDVVNPVAKTDSSSPLYGMPILDVVEAKNVIVIKRGQGKGFAGVENHLFYRDNTRMLYGDGQEMVNALVQAVKEL